MMLFEAGLGLKSQSRKELLGQTWLRGFVFLPHTNPGNHCRIGLGGILRKHKRWDAV